MNAHLVPTDAQLDALRELANLGSGDAVKALSQMLGGRPVELGPPSAVLPAESGPLSRLLGGDGRSLVAIALEFDGAFRGRFVLALSAGDAAILGALLTGRPASEPLDAMDVSALSEAANILASASLSAASRVLKAPMLPSPPNLRAGTVREGVAHVLGERGGPVALSTPFWSEGEQQLRGLIVAIPRGETLPGLLDRLGV